MASWLFCGAELPGSCCRLLQSRGHSCLISNVFTADWAAVDFGRARPPCLLTFSEVEHPEPRFRNWNLVSITACSLFRESFATLFFGSLTSLRVLVSFIHK